MNKSNIANGQMFLHYNPTYMDKPKVWVKVKSEIFGNHYGEDTEEVSLFVDNNALVKASINPKYKDGPRYKIGLTEKWSITDEYYGKMVRKGEFVPLDDLAKCDDITEQLGWPAYVLDF